MLDVDLIWEPVQYYTKEDILSEMAKAVLGMGDELVGGTLWFVPVVVMSSGLLGVIVSFSRRAFNYFHKLWMKYAVQKFAVMFCAIVGYIAEMRQMKLVANMQVVLVVMPFLWVGYFFRNHIQINIKIWVCCSGCSVWYIYLCSEPEILIGFNLLAGLSIYVDCSTCGDIYLPDDCEKYHKISDNKKTI